ncbi:MAG TPA: acetylglutamate kinase [Acidimicrobiales bacterium]
MTASADRTRAHDKAAVLVEALPYISRWQDRVVVVKYGGNALAGAVGDGGEAAALAAFASDVVLMRSVGMRPVVVHGGGPQIGALLARLGKRSEFVGGLRVTDAETLDVVRMVLLGQVNPDLVAAINVHGPMAVGLSGSDSRLLTTRTADPALGFVGDVAAVDPAFIHRLIDQRLIPVVATIGADEDGQAHNVNADTAAGAIARAVGAAKLIFLTDVEGLRSDAGDPGSVLSAVTVDQVGSMIASGAITAGMIQKVEACVAAVRGGVGQAHILDGRVPHALLLEIFTDEGVGTMITSA